MGPKTDAKNCNVHIPFYTESRLIQKRLRADSIVPAHEHQRIQENHEGNGNVVKQKVYEENNGCALAL